MRELKRNPLKLGYHTTVWTVVLLSEHLNATYGYWGAFLLPLFQQTRYHKDFHISMKTLVIAIAFEKIA